MIPTIRDPFSSIAPVQHRENVHTHPCGIGQAPSVLESAANSRLTAKEGTPICTWIQTAAKTIKTFFVHGFADAQMLVKAIIAKVTSEQTADQRIQEVSSWVNVIRALPPNTIAHNAFQQQFFRSDTLRLFYNFEGHINQGRCLLPRTLTLEIQEDMLRECHQVIFFQKLLSGRVFYS